MPTRIRADVDPQRSLVEARTDGGQLIRMDADPPFGDDAAAGPIETVLAALAGCTAMDVASLLRKKRQDATGYAIEVVGEQAAEHPRVLIDVSVEHRVAGRVEPEALRRSIELSATRYCPVSAMLSAVTRVEHRYVLTAEDGTEHAAVVAVVGPGTRPDRA
jgi:putative redox protein